ncbi:MAG: hypothetical protein ABJP70_01120 [Erythrobacter sp.]
MPALSRSYTSDHVLRSDGAVEFACSQDVAEWPWLALAPQHPLTLQTQNFWTSVGATQALGQRDDSKWSALTWTNWELGEIGAGRATHGFMRNQNDEEKLNFEIELFDVDNRQIAIIRGKGVVFRNRNFEQWREGSKIKARTKKIAPTEFVYSDRRKLGLSKIEPPLIAPIIQANDGSLSSAALVTKANGLIPGHPYFSGSGDHVNAPHLSEIARQVVSLVNDGEAISITKGEMDMHRYIEFGTPIAIAVERSGDQRLSVAISQLDRSCAKISMEWHNA